MVSKMITGCVVVLLLTAVGLTATLAGPASEAVAGVTTAPQIDVVWNYTLGGIADEGARSIIGTSDGGYAIAGWTYSHGVDDSDIWLVKTDANGQVEWNETYGGKNDDTISHRTNALIQTADGGFALFGWTRSYGAGELDFWLVKTDANGQAQWNYTYGGVFEEWAGSFIQTVDGGYALAGSTGSYGAGEEDSDGWLVKTDANGQAQWNYTYGGTEYDDLISVIQTADGGYALAGRTYSRGAGDSDGWLVKTDANGQAQWNRTFGGSGGDHTDFLIQLADGGYILAGNSESYGGAWLLKTDATGQVLWNYTYGEPRGVFSLIQTADGGYALTGWIIEEGEESVDCWLIKIDADGQLAWEKIFGGKETDFGSDLLQAADGDLVIAGWTGSYGAGNGDMWLLKTPDAPPSTTPPATPGLEVVPLLLAASLLVFRRGWKRQPAFRRKKE